MISKYRFLGWDRAWVLGLLYMNGHIKNRTGGPEVCLRLDDFKTIEKAAVVLGNPFEISVRPKSAICELPIPKGDIVYGLVTSSSSFRPKLLEREFPPISDGVISNFICGCWDTRNRIESDGPKPIAMFSCTSRHLISAIRDHLFENGVVRHRLHKLDPEIGKLNGTFGNGPYPLRIYRSSKRSNSLYLRIDEPGALWNLYQFLYRTSFPAIYDEPNHDHLREIVMANMSGRFGGLSKPYRYLKSGK